jgi:acetate kinase
MSRAVLTLNAGSSSVKFALFTGPGLVCALRGEIENLDANPHFHANDPQGKILVERRFEGEKGGFDAVLHALLDFVDDHLGDAELEAVGHRVVHGGPDHVAPERVTQALLASLAALTPLDPLHMPLNLAPIRAVAAARPDLAQIACFDTAFHHTMPELARIVPIPHAMAGSLVRRYGFHGLSYEYIAARLAEILPKLAAGRVIVAHLGSGASLCAMQDGRSIETTTGFSALDGLVMATRCGNIDPGVLLYLGQQGRSGADIEDILYRQSGLLGVSGISGDVRVLQASADPRARLALDLFAYRIAGEIGRLAMALGGLDGIVFTAGVGEHAASVRHDVIARLAWLGMSLDTLANERNDACISPADCAIQVRVIATDEETMIARHTARVAAVSSGTPA